MRHNLATTTTEFFAVRTPDGTIHGVKDGDWWDTQAEAEASLARLSKGAEGWDLVSTRYKTSHTVPKVVKAAHVDETPDGDEPDQGDTGE